VTKVAMLLLTLYTLGSLAGGFAVHFANENTALRKSFMSAAVKMQKVNSFCEKIKLKK
jgi:hypothetical protein